MAHFAASLGPMISLLGAGEDVQNSTNSGNFTSSDLQPVKTNFNYLAVEGEKPPKYKQLKKHLEECSLSTFSRVGVL